MISGKLSGHGLFCYDAAGHGRKRICKCIRQATRVCADPLLLNVYSASDIPTSVSRKFIYANNIGQAT